MPNTHNVLISTSMLSWDVDAARIAGVYNTGALDNGTIVTLGSMGLASNPAPAGTIGGYEYTVVPANANQTGSVWIVDTPIPGASVEMQVYDDPRYFYNEAGRPLSLRHLTPEVDHIELYQNDVTYTVGQYATIGANGILAPAASAPTGAGENYFTVVGQKTLAIGQESVTTYILRAERV